MGLRIQHQELGKGAVTNLNPKLHWVTFIEGVLETMGIDPDFDYP